MGVVGAAHEAPPLLVTHLDLLLGVPRGRRDVHAADVDEVVGGVNVAVVSGLGLIGGAVLLAVVYAFACRVPNGGGRP